MRHPNENLNPGINAQLLDGLDSTAYALVGEGGGSMTAAEILTELLTVDGPGSGLNADLLDGSSSAAFATSAQGATADLAIPKATLTTNDDILTRAAGVPDRITRANLAADTAFTSKFAAGISVPGVAHTIYVSTEGNDANSGRTDSHAKLTLQAAITTLAGGGRGKIKLGPGVFNSATMITVSGHGYDYINIEGSGMGTTKLMLTATAEAVLKIVNVSEFTLRDFTVAVNAGTATNGLLITESSGSSEVGFIENVRAADEGGTMNNGFGVGPDTSDDVAQMLFIGCEAQVCAVAGWMVGNGAAGNVLDHRAFGCLAASCGVGVYINGGGITWLGGSVLGSTVADFKCSAPPTTPILIEGVRSEGSLTFWEFLGGGTSGGTTVTLINNVVADFTEAAGLVVNHIARVNLSIIGGSYFGGVADARMVIGESVTECEFVAQGVCVGRTATTSPFEPYGGVSARMTISGCSRMNPADGIVAPAVEWNTVVIQKELPSDGIFQFANHYFGAPTATIGVDTPDTNFVFYVPMNVLEAVTLDRIGIEVTTGVATSAPRLGIYKQSGATAVLILGTAPIDGTSTGFKEVTISQRLTPGRYLLAFCNQVAACAVRCQLVGYTITGSSATALTASTTVGGGRTSSNTSSGTDALVNMTLGNVSVKSPRILVRVAA